MTGSPDVSWVRDLLGIPWVAGGRGPGSFDCWGLVKWIYGTQLSVTLEDFAGIPVDDVRAVGTEMTRGVLVAPWHPSSTPGHLDLVAMGGNRLIHHVGVWLDIDGGLVLHTSSGKSVCAQGLSQVKTTGTQTIKFYHHESRRR